jgi:hypothetical protein
MNIKKIKNEDIWNSQIPDNVSKQKIKDLREKIVQKKN